MKSYGLNVLSMAIAFAYATSTAAIVAARVTRTFAMSAVLYVCSRFTWLHRKTEVRAVEPVMLTVLPETMRQWMAKRERPMSNPHWRMCPSV